MIPRIVMLRQDDPTKCTAARLVRFGLARATRKLPAHGIILDPYSDRVLLSGDRLPICAVDCSWRLAPGQFHNAKNGRTLPPLLAGNPVNHARVGMLSTAEALAAALYIIGRRDDAITVMAKFRWGHTFLELNGGLLDEYASARTSDEAAHIAESYGLKGAHNRHI